MTARATRARPADELTALRERVLYVIQRDPDLEEWQVCERFNLDRDTLQRWLAGASQSLPRNWSIDIREWLARTRKNYPCTPFNHHKEH